MSGADGYRAISEVVARMETLARWYRKFKPDLTSFTLRRSDYDLLCRHPDTAALFQIVMREGAPHWGGFILKHDKALPAKKAVHS